MPACDTAGMKFAVVTPVYGRQELTDALLGDIATERALADVLIIDNGGDYVEHGWEHVMRPGQNLGWLRGTNLGIRTGQAMGRYDAYVLMNNDVRLSPLFFQHLGRACAVLPGVGVVAPVYDAVHAQQRSEYTGPAAFYRSISVDRPVKWVDGTCLVLPSETLTRVGLLDEDHFGAWGWGADFDYCLRVRQAGMGVYVTERAYINHYREQTVKTLVDDFDAYWRQAEAEMDAGMNTKWGPDWRAVLGWARPGPDCRNH